MSGSSHENERESEDVPWQSLRDATLWLWRWAVISLVAGCAAGCLTGIVIVALFSVGASFDFASKLQLFAVVMALVEYSIGAAIFGFGFSRKPALSFDQQMTIASAEGTVASGLVGRLFGLILLGLEASPIAVGRLLSLSSAYRRRRPPEDVNEIQGLRTAAIVLALAPVCLLAVASLMPRSSAPKSVGSGGDGIESISEFRRLCQELTSIDAELERALLTKTEQHPDVVQLKKKKAEQARKLKPAAEEAAESIVVFHPESVARRDEMLKLYRPNSPEIFALDRKISWLTREAAAVVGIHQDARLFELIPPGTTLWQFGHTLQRTVGDSRSSPCLSDGRVYFGDWYGDIRCLDARSGNLLWKAKVGRYKTGGIAWSSPSVSEGRLYVGVGDGEVHCLDAVTGRSQWAFSTGAPISTSPCIAFGRLYVSGNDSYLYCLDAKRGAELWKFETGELAPLRDRGSSPCVVDGRAIVGCGDGRICCLDDETGRLLWTFVTDGFVQSSPCVTGGRVYVGSSDSKLYCLDVASGALCWEFGTGGQVLVSPCAANGQVYVGSADLKIHCVGAQLGEKRWTFETGSHYPSGLCCANGRIFVTCDDNVYCLDAEQGTRVWEIEGESSIVIFGTQACLADGRVYLSCRNSSLGLCCVWSGETSTGGWNMFGGGPEHGGFNRRER